jgi:hypothetical protein
MDNVQNCDSYISRPSTQTCRSYLHEIGSTKILLFITNPLLEIMDPEDKPNILNCGSDLSVLRAVKWISSLIINELFIFRNKL